MTGQRDSDYDGPGEAWDGEPDSRQPAEFPRVQLSDLIRAGVPVPELICNDLLYPKGVHSLSGEPDSGKTTLAHWFAAYVMRSGDRVAMFDEECGPEMTAEKLIALGVTEQEIDEYLFYYPFLGKKWSPADIADLTHTVGNNKPRLTIFDSAGAFMGIAGMNENDGGDVSRFYQGVVTPLARVLGSTVLLIDHDAKGGNGGSNGGSASRFARGHGAKLAAIDVMFKVTCPKPFSRAQDGEIVLTVTKDRRGWLYPRSHRIAVSSRLELKFMSVADAKVAEARDAVNNLSPAEAKVLSVLTENAAGKKRIIDRVRARYQHGLRPETVAQVMTKLVSLGMAECVTPGGGRGNEAAWVRAHPAQPALMSAQEVAERELAGPDPVPEPDDGDTEPEDGR